MGFGSASGGSEAMVKTVFRGRAERLWGLLLAIALAAAALPAAAAEESPGGGAELEFHNNVGLFIGGATEFADERETSTLLGFEYERGFTIEPAMALDLAGETDAILNYGVVFGLNFWAGGVRRSKAICPHCGFRSGADLPGAATPLHSVVLIQSSQVCGIVPC
jgi:hypothetical protein